MSRIPTAKEKALAEKIEATANAGLANFAMTLTTWPPEFRAIMWETVAAIAANRARDAHAEHDGVAK